jgi:hypothetical protein
MSTLFSVVGLLLKKSFLHQRTTERDMFVEWVSSVARHYHAGEPKHVSLPDKSFFTIMERKVFCEMSPSQIQIHLRTGVIVIPDTNLPSVTFSHDSIRDLNSLNTDVRIEGMYNISRCHSSLF